MSALRKVLGSLSVVGGVLGAAALGGVTAQRAALQRYRELDQIPGGGRGNGFGQLAAGRSYSVAAHDGVALYVEEVGPDDAPVTVVFSHGWTLQLGAWHFQRIALSDWGSAAGRSGHVNGEFDGAPSPGSSGSSGSSGASESSGTCESSGAAGPAALRLVFYDQRSHGRSSRAEPGHTTIADLADDLAAVIATAAPTGPVVLVGHSMGGMAILSLAGRDPKLFAERVHGAALISTSASETQRGMSRYVQVNGSNPLLPVVMAAAARYPGLVERGRHASHDAVWLLTRTLGFGSRQVPAPVVDYLDQMISATPMGVIAEFAPAVFSHDELDSVPALAHIPVLIAVGDEDRMTPPDRSRAIAAQLPDAELLVIPAAGHMAIMEASGEINAALGRLVDAAWRHSLQTNGILPVANCPCRKETREDQI